MDDLLKPIGAVVAIFVAILLGPLIGGCAAWVVGLVFGDVILGIFSQFGLKGVTMWQVGVFFGFVSGFLKTKTTVE